MKAKEKQELFYSELNELLHKYGAEIRLEEIGRGYSLDYKILVEFNFDETLEDTGIVPDLDLGRFADGSI